MNIEEIKQQFAEKLRKISTEQGLIALEVEFLGKKGKLTEVLKGLAELSLVEKKRIGLESNKLKDLITAELTKKRNAVLAQKWSAIAESEKQSINDLEKLALVKSLKLEDRGGHLHPLSNFIFKIERVFQEMGYEVVEGPDIETDFNNFTALNITEDHPSRDEHDTFYIDDLQHPARKDLLLRTQTSAMQVQYMREHKDRLPIKIIVPGKTFRRDDDASHSPMFHQFEGLVVAERLSMGELKSTLGIAMKKLLGEDTKIRFRSSYFPFVEPGLEVDVTCSICNGKGCNVCKQTGWLELLGAGMVHPQVLRNGGIDPDKYSGFAFGTGIERLVMMKHAIPNIKMLYDNDIRFLKQF